MRWFRAISRHMDPKDFDAWKVKLRQRRQLWEFRKGFRKDKLHVGDRRKIPKDNTASATYDNKW
jgi:hypothetical protein